jgi:hypothetical protein
MMGKATDITIDAKLNFTVDRKTAETCLRMVEIFCNTNRVNLIAEKADNGELEFHFQPEFNQISEETLKALRTMGALAHPE